MSAENLHCSPKAYVNGLTNHTCFSKEDLINISTSYNKHQRKNKINITESNSTKTLHKKIKTKLKPKCGDNEACWIEQDFIDHQKRHTLEELFRPKKPRSWYKNNRTWLNTYDILYVMEQYEQKYDDFLFLGVYPIDFTQSNSFGSCIGDMMCTFDVRQMSAKKKERFGMVLNLDKHNEPGSHWVAMFCNINPSKENFGIYYYDSVAYPPDKQVRAFMHKIYTQIQRTHPNHADKFEYGVNKIQKQFKNTECGIFSIVFLTQCLKNVTFSNICIHMKKDDDMNKIRDVIYRPSVQKE
jgi:hypothetical protein